MIIQRHKRGDYMITEKGFMALLAIVELYVDLGGKRIKAETENVAQAMGT